MVGSLGWSCNGCNGCARILKSDTGYQISKVLPKMETFLKSDTRVTDVNPKLCIGRGCQTDRCRLHKLSFRDSEVRGGHHAVQQVAILGRCLRSAWWLRVTVSCLFKKAHGPRPLHRPPSIFGKHPLQKWSFRDTLTHRTKQSVQHVWTPPTVHVRYIRYLSYFPTDRDRLSFRDTRTHRLDRLGCPRPLLKSVT